MRKPIVMGRGDSRGGGRIGQRRTTNAASIGPVMLMRQNGRGELEYDENGGEDRHPHIPC
jgi:hypothetical protein